MEYHVEKVCWFLVLREFVLSCNFVSNFGLKYLGKQTSLDCWTLWYPKASSRLKLSFQATLPTYITP